MQNDPKTLLRFYKQIGVESFDKKNRYTSSTNNTMNPFPKSGFSDSFRTESQPSALCKELEHISTLEELREKALSYEGCPLKHCATNTVFCDGNPSSKIMLIGEAPGEQEDKMGIPFCGKSGILLDKMLQSIELDRSKVYITNTVFWRPPGNRRPSDEEIESCKPFLVHHIRIVAPKLIILVGSTAVSALLRSKDRISQMRGRMYQYQNDYITSPIATTVIFHPSYLLRQPAQKKIAWEDLKFIKEYILQNEI